MHAFTCQLNSTELTRQRNSHACPGTDKLPRNVPCGQRRSSQLFVSGESGESCIVTKAVYTTRDMHANSSLFRGCRFTRACTGAGGRRSGGEPGVNQRGRAWTTQVNCSAPTPQTLCGQTPRMRACLPQASLWHRSWRLVKTASRFSARPRVVGDGWCRISTVSSRVCRYAGHRRGCAGMEVHTGLVYQYTRFPVRAGASSRLMWSDTRRCDLPHRRHRTPGLNRCQLTCCRKAHLCPRARVPRRVLCRAVRLCGCCNPFIRSSNVECSPFVGAVHMIRITVLMRGRRHNGWGCAVEERGILVTA